MPINFTLDIETSVGVDEIGEALHAAAPESTLVTNGISDKGLQATILPFDKEDWAWFFPATGVKPELVVHFGRVDHDADRLFTESLALAVRFLEEVRTRAVFETDSGEIVFIFRDGVFFLNDSWSTSDKIQSNYPQMTLAHIDNL